MIYLNSALLVDNLGCVIKLLVFANLTGDK